jgi:hypothetical protein
MHFKAREHRTRNKKKIGQWDEKGNDKKGNKMSMEEKRK